MWLLKNLMGPAVFSALSMAIVLSWPNPGKVIAADVEGSKDCQSLNKEEMGLDLH